MALAGDVNGVVLCLRCSEVGLLQVEPSSKPGWQDRAFRVGTDAGGPSVMMLLQKKMGKWTCPLTLFSPPYANDFTY